MDFSVALFEGQTGFLGRVNARKFISDYCSRISITKNLIGGEREQGIFCQEIISSSNPCLFT